MVRRTYRGGCHCGAFRFEVECEPIDSACRCNCSICIRRNALMSDHYFPPEAFRALDGLETLTCYRFGDRLVDHYFCGTCGIYTHHAATAKPDHLRINLGCVDELNARSLPVREIDGRSF